MQNANEKNETSGGIIDFLQKYRNQLFICAGVILVSLVVCFAVLMLRDSLRNRAIIAVEELESRYDDLHSSITDEDTDEEDYTDDVKSLLSDLETFAQKNSGYAGSKAWSIIGSIRSEKKEWAEAEEVWIAAAEAGTKTYLAPLAWFNAGVAAEEQGKTEEAIEHYSKSISAPSGFSAAPRAQFAIGRLRETLDDTAAAIEAYRAVISGWPYDTVWVNLAHSRIIALEVK